jgi:uncharacterized protein YndB with AHSA1/START domain
VRRYEFLTTWVLEAPRSLVWSSIEDASAWPEWWHGVESCTELAHGEDGGVGRRYRVRWRSVVPYVLEFDFEVDRVELPVTMSGRATGDLEGAGTWRLFEQNGVTAVTYDWRVVATRRWMRVVGPVARPVFEWNHDWVMHQGAIGIARRLGVRLLAAG